MSQLTITRSRLERLVAERGLTDQKIEDMLKLAEDEGRDPNELEREHLDRYRSRAGELEGEIATLAGELERAEGARDVSRLLRSGGGDLVPAQQSGGEPQLYRTFAAYARDELIVRYPLIANAVAGPTEAMRVKEQAGARLEAFYRVQNTLTSDVAGLLPPTHLSQIMDIIDSSRPVVASARNVPLTTGQLTYPRITGRPTALKQSAEKTEAGTAKMSVVMDTISADTYLAGGDLSWQTISWSTPDALTLWFDLAAESYARQTEAAACVELNADANGTSSPKLGTAGTEDFATWRAIVMAGLNSIYSNTGGRAKTDTLYLSADKFFSLAALGTSSVLQVSAVGSVNAQTMTGTFSGLRVIGSYGFAANTAILGDGSAFLVGENPGAPVEMRAVEPTIGGMQVGVIGAFKSKVFDSTRFIHIA